MTVQAQAANPSGAAPRRRWLTQARQEAIEGYVCIAPWLVGLLLFTAGPLVASIIISFTRWDIVNPPIWLGLANYRRAFLEDPDFFQSLKVTLTWAYVTLPAHLILGLGLSLLLNIKVKGMNVYRTLFYLPSVLPAVATTLLWMWLFNTDFGLINWFLGLFHIAGPHWFQSPRYALPALMIMSMWGVGGGAVIYLAGLQNIPPHLYEAAEIDGAGSWSRFKAVTIPLLTPTIFFQLVMGLIGSFQVFVSSYIATGGSGDPMKSTLFYMLYLYNKAFVVFEMGYASALAWILAVVILLVTILVFKTSPYWVHYEAEKPGR